jgi:hypothetical protein
MHIIINIDPKITYRDEEIEITLRLVDTEREEEEKIWWVEEDRPLWRDIVKVMIAIMAGKEFQIGISNRYKHEDTYGQFFIHPGEIAEAINDMRGCSMDNWVPVTSQAVGRAMQNWLDLESRNRKNTGIPYYFEDNKAQLLRLANEFELDVPDKWLEEDGDGCED